MGLTACGAPAVTPRDVVLYASGAELQSINPLFTVHPLAKQVQKYVLFLTLATYDSALRPVPRLASWVWSADRRTLTFRLRHDVRWHDGVPVTAADVVWTLDQARNPLVAYPRAGELAAVTSVSRADSYTVVVRFARSAPTFPDVLTDLAVLPAHCFVGIPPGRLREAPFNQAPVGDGPFRFVAHRPGARWVFRRDSTFPAALGRPHFDRFVVVIVDEPTTKLAALTSGELDFAGISTADAKFVRADPRLRVIDYPIFLTYGLVYNLRRPPFDDVRVRQALTMALDRRAIVDAYLYGFGTVADGPVPPDHPWYRPVPPVRYDTGAAARLLDSAGWHRGADGIRVKQGRRFSFSLLTVGTGDNALEQMIQWQLRQIGVQVRIEPRELATFLATAQSPRRDFDALITGIPGDLALGYVTTLFDGDGPLAYSGLVDPRLHAAFNRVRVAQNERELKRAWGTIQTLLARDRPVTWLYHARGVQGVARRITDIRIDLRGELAGIAQWHIATENR